jgi:hypothetical protein
MKEIAKMDGNQLLSSNPAPLDRPASVQPIVDGNRLTGRYASTISV